MRSSQTRSEVFSKSGIPIDVHSNAQVFNLTVLVRTGKKVPVVARAANLAIPQVEAQTIREALSKLVDAAKKEIGERASNSASVPWIDPPNQPTESESRYLVPLHL
ncbi:MAG: hypothetical protein VXZ82_21425 [Planctomycetota bacterium]|nr:hypothetical protein [Planctomycetota bacterium]